MPRRKAVRTRSKQSKEEILAATVRALSKAPAAVVTVEAVAREASCAKGLVHYHYKTKDALLAAAATYLWNDRSARWQAALASPDPQAAIDASWKLLTEESANGVTRACASLAVESGTVTVRAVRGAIAEFSKELATGVAGLFRRIGVRPMVPPDELGTLLAAVVAGFGHQLDAGAPAGGLEGGYAAFWAGMLSFGGP